MTSGNFQLSNQLMFCTHVLELFDLLRENFFQNSEVRSLPLNFPKISKGYLRYKTITPQIVLSKAQVRNFFIP